MATKKEILAGLLDENLLKVLKVFINNTDQQFYLREVAKRARVPATTTYRIIQHLKKLKLIDENLIKRFKFYKINEENAQFLIDLLADRKSAVQEFVEMIKNDPNIELIVLHGREEKTKANILVIGNEVDQELIRMAAYEIKQKYNFNIIHLTLAPEQYNQMSSMGLYPGKKIILYGK